MTNNAVYTKEDLRTILKAYLDLVSAHEHVSAAFEYGGIDDFNEAEQGLAEARERLESVKALYALEPWPWPHSASPVGEGAASS